MFDHDDVRFSAFTRDLARRHRRPRSYPKTPATTDCLEQLCGGGVVLAVPEAAGSEDALPDSSNFGQGADEHALS